MSNANTIPISQYLEEKENLLVASELQETGLYTANLIQVIIGSSKLALQDTVQVTDMFRRGDYFDLRFVSKLSGTERIGRISLGGIITGTSDDYVSGFNEAYFKASTDEMDLELWDMCEKVVENLEPAYIRRQQPVPLKYLEMPLPE